MNTDIMPKTSFYRCTQIVFLTLTLVFLFSLTSWAQSHQINLARLVETSEKYDGKIVSFEAEAIGDPLSGKKGIWFNVQSGEYNMGIFVKNQDIINSINYWGSYKERGDLIKIKGIFHKNCSVHGGRDLHLVDFEVIEKGKKIKLKATDGKKKFALFSFVIFLTLGSIYLIKERLWQQK